ETLRGLGSVGDDAPRRLLSMEDSLAQANDIGKVGKSTETIAGQVRAGIANFDARFVSSSELSSTEESITKFIDF
ncbi:hypothetical protein BRD06_12265, partial [Halobacteriales archaeon QS_9_67_15]